MTESLAELVGPPRAHDGLVFGIVTGVVTNIQDPDGLGRVRVHFPWLADDAESAWARVATPMAGQARGFSFLPDVHDEVLVAFQHGRVDAPVVLGSLWNGVRKPPVEDAEGENNTRSITSRSGHVVLLDDTDGKEKIEIVDRTGKNRIVIDAAKNTISLEADADITIATAGGKLALSGKEVAIAATGGSLSIAAETTMSVKAQADLTLKGQMVNIN